MSKRRVAATVIEDDDSSDDEPSQSSQSKRASTQLNPGQLTSLANDLAHFIIVNDQKSQPIRRIDIRKHVLKEFSKSFNVVFSKAKEKLNEVFGMDVVEMVNRKDQYMLINKIRTDADDNLIHKKEEEEQKMGLLLAILSLIFMNDHVLPEASLWSTLKILGINPENPHPVFGDVKKLVNNEFKSKGYLEIEKLMASDPPMLVFSWGHRAKVEVSKMDCLKFVCLIDGSRTPEQWADRYKDAMEEMHPGRQMSDRRSQ